MKRPAGLAGVESGSGVDSGSWLVIMAGLGVFLAAADQTSVVAILPRMIDGIGLAQDQFYRAAWIVNGYILGYVVAMPLMGRLADAYGRGRVFTMALLVFCAGSAWVALSNDLTSLTLARTLQAAGGGALVPVALSMVAQRTSFERRAIGLGAMAAAAEAGGLVGPLWGGVVAELIGWRGVFWINLPLCLPLAAAIWRQGRGDSLTRQSNLDLGGALLLGGSLITLAFALTDDPIAPRASALQLGLYAGAALFFLAFVLLELRVSRPIIDLRLLRKPALSAALLTNGLVGGALIVAMVNVPLFTNVILNGSALQGGLNLMRLTVGLAAGAFLGGFLTNRLGFAPTAVLGLLLAGSGLFGMSRWHDSPSFLAMTLPLAWGGLGFGLVIAPVSTAVINQVEEGERATMASLLTVIRLVGALVGVALLTTQGLSGFYSQAGLIPLDDPRFADLVRGLQIDAFRHSFLIAAWICFATVIPAAFLGLGRRIDSPEAFAPTAPDR